MLGDAVHRKGHLDRCGLARRLPRRCEPDQLAPEPRQRGIDTPRLDAELILCKVLGMERLQLYLAHDRPMNPKELGDLRDLVKRRGSREPIAWLLGTQGFHAIDLDVIPGVLVPRPDTETLVEAAIEWIDPSADPVYVADVGSGSERSMLRLAVPARRRGVVKVETTSPRCGRVENCCGCGCF